MLKEIKIDQPMYSRPRAVNRKTSEGGVKNLCCLSIEDVSCIDFSRQTPVLRANRTKPCFFGTFVVRQKYGKKKGAN